MAEGLLEKLRKTGENARITAFEERKTKYQEFKSKFWEIRRRNMGFLGWKSILRAVYKLLGKDILPLSEEDSGELSNINEDLLRLTSDYVLIDRGLTRNPFDKIAGEKYADTYEGRLLRRVEDLHRDVTCYHHYVEPNQDRH